MFYFNIKTQDYYTLHYIQNIGEHGEAQCQGQIKDLFPGVHFYFECILVLCVICTVVLHVASDLGMATIVYRHSLVFRPQYYK